MTRRPGTASHLSLEADKMKIHKIASTPCPTTAHLVQSPKMALLTTPAMFFCLGICGGYGGGVAVVAVV